MWKKALLQYNAVDFGVHKYAKTKDVVLHSIIQQSKVCIKNLTFTCLYF